MIAPEFALFAGRVLVARRFCTHFLGVVFQRETERKQSESSPRSGVGLPSAGLAVGQDGAVVAVHHGTHHFLSFQLQPQVHFGEPLFYRAKDLFQPFLFSTFGRIGDNVGGLLLVPFQTI